MNAQGLFNKAQKERGEEHLEEAIKSYTQARDKAKEEDNKWLAAECQHMIGVIKYQQEKYVEAEGNLQIAKKEFEELGDQDLLGAVWRDLGLVAFEQKDYPKARERVEQSIGVLKGGNKLGHLGISQVKLGLVLAAQEQYLKAEEMIREGIVSIEKSEDRFFASIAYHNLAQVQKEQGKKEEAVASAQKSLQILDEVAGPDEHQSRRQKLENFLKDLTSV